MVGQWEGECVGGLARWYPVWTFRQHTWLAASNSICLDANLLACLPARQQLASLPGRLLACLSCVISV